MPADGPTAADLKGFDAVVVATGAKMVRPAVSGIDLPSVVTFQNVLRCVAENCEYHPADSTHPVDCGPAVLIWGDHFAAADTAEKLALNGRRVYIVTEHSAFGTWMEPCHRDVMLKRFKGSNGEGLRGKTFEYPVTIIPNSTVTEIRCGEVSLMDNRFERSTLAVDHVVLAAMEPAGSPYEDLLASGVPVVKIGDCREVRNLRAAVSEGADAGLILDSGLILNANRGLVSRHPTEANMSFCGAELSSVENR